MDFKDIKFVCTDTYGFNKTGNLKVDKDGYAWMVIGAMNMFNSANMYYDYEASKELFQESSQLMRRIKNRALRGELGHPRRQPGQSDLEYRMRLLDILETNVVCFFRQIKLDFTNYKDDNGNPIVAILGEVCPDGPHAHVFERAINNVDSNICFSIRSFTHDWIEGGIIKRKLLKISTFDYVNEPGMSVAMRKNSPALESLVDLPMTRGTLVTMNNQINSHNAGVGMESQLVTLDDLFGLVGLERKPTGNPVSVSPWAGWTK